MALFHTLHHTHRPPSRERFWPLDFPLTAHYSCNISTHRQIPELALTSSFTSSTSSPCHDIWGTTCTIVTSLVCDFHRDKICQRHWGTSEVDRRTLLLRSRDWGIGSLPPGSSHCHVLEEKRAFTWCVRQYNLPFRRGRHHCHLCAPYRLEDVIQLHICHPVPPPS